MLLDSAVEKQHAAESPVLMQWLIRRFCRHCSLRSHQIDWHPPTKWCMLLKEELDLMSPLPQDRLAMRR